jgi:hypothetical protein
MLVKARIKIWITKFLNQRISKIVAVLIIKALILLIRTKTTAKTGFRLQNPNSIKI